MSQLLFSIKSMYKSIIFLLLLFVSCSNSSEDMLEIVESTDSRPITDEQIEKNITPDSSTTTTADSTTTTNTDSTTTTTRTSDSTTTTTRTSDSTTTTTQKCDND